MTLSARRGVSAHGLQVLRSPSHYFLSDLVGNVLPQRPFWGLRESTFGGSVSIFIEELTRLILTSFESKFDKGKLSNFGHGFCYMVS